MLNIVDCHTDDLRAGRNGYRQGDVSQRQRALAKCPCLRQPAIRILVEAVQGRQGGNEAIGQDTDVGLEFDAGIGGAIGNQVHVNSPWILELPYCNSAGGSPQERGIRQWMAG